MKEKRKIPYTNKELFEIICKKLSEDNKLPDILDYHLADRHLNNINSYQWDVICSLNYGGSEGIYLDVAAKGSFDGSLKIIDLGTFKTLHEDNEAMHKMATLFGDFVIVANKFVNENLDDFTFSGFDLDFFDEKEKRVFGYTCENFNAVLATYKREKERCSCDKVILTFNKTKQSQVICNEDDLLSAKAKM